MEQPLKGQVAIVTGGSRGIGAGIARELAKRGAHVVLTYVASQTKAQAVVSDIESHGWPKALAVQADCGSPEEASRKIVAETTRAFGNGINIIVNNAANGADHLVSEMTREIFDVMFHTNVLFPILLVKEAMRYLQRYARIVNVSSTAARGALNWSVDYPATKAALEAVTRCMAAQLGESHEATVNAINPGPVATDMWADAPEGVEEAITARTLAAKRIAQVDDIIPIVAFLCDPSARWITGNVTCANGGLLVL